MSSRVREPERLAVGADELVSHGVEAEVAGESECGDDVRRSDECVGSGVSVVTAGEVTVVRGDDGVGLALLDVATIPLTATRTARVGQDKTADVLESLDDAVTLDGRTDLLRTGGNGELALGLKTMRHSLLGNVRRTGHVLVRRISARADESNLEFRRPAVFLDLLLELRDRSSQVGSEGTVDMGLEFREILSQTLY